MKEKTKQQSPAIRKKLLSGGFGLGIIPVCIFCLMMSCVVIYRFILFNTGIEYDEIWTLIYYATADFQKIFTDLATPNNHPLNSFLIALFLKILPESFAVRFPALIAGLLSIPILWCLCVKMFRSVRIAACAVFLASASASSLYLGTTGRGYELQTAFILIYALATWMWAETRKNRYLFFQFLAGIGSVLTLPTSILWIFGISLVHCFREWSNDKTKVRTLLPQAFAYLILAAALFAFYSINYEKFLLGQQFGVTVHSFAQLLQNSAVRYFAVCGPIMGFLSLCAILFVVKSPHRRYRLLVPALFLIILIPFAAAYVTKLGPARVYAPCVPFAAILATLVIRHLSELSDLSGVRKRILLMLLIAAGVSVFDFYNGPLDWNRVDWLKNFATVRIFPKNHYVLLSPFDGLPVAYNNGDAHFNDASERSAAFGQGGDSRILTWGTTGFLNGIDSKQSQKSVSIPKGIHPLKITPSGAIYGLRKFDLKDAEILLLKLDASLSAPERGALTGALSMRSDTLELLIANPFFNIGKYPDVLIWKRKTGEKTPSVPAGVQAYVLFGKDEQ